MFELTGRLSATRRPERGRSSIDIAKYELTSASTSSEIQKTSTATMTMETERTMTMTMMRKMMTRTMTTRKTAMGRTTMMSPQQMPA